MKMEYKELEEDFLRLGWNVLKIKDIFDLFPTASYSRADLNETDEIKYIHYGDIHTKYHFHLNIQKSDLPRISNDLAKKYTFIEEGDLIISDASEDYDGVGKTVEVINVKNEKIIAGLHTFHLRDKYKTFSHRFRGFALLSPFVREQFYRLATGTKVYSISKDALNNIKIPIPSHDEQQIIAECLSLWDRAINKQIALIDAKQNRQNALFQQLLTGKKRLPSFLGEWKEYSYDSILLRVKRTEKWDDNKLYNLLSVRRRSGGAFPRESLFGSQIAVKQLVSVRENEFLISKMQIVHGASAIVKKKFEGYYVSGSYIIITSKDNSVLLPKYLDFYSRQKRFYHQTYISSYGVHIEKMTFDFQTFMNMKIILPSINEQEMIIKVLETSEKEISFEKQLLKDLKQQKKALTQKLLTGKIRFTA